jgi:hypothetical protein
MDKQAKHLVEFGPFRMDLEERVLMRDQETITLSPKAFETLLVLVYLYIFFAMAGPLPSLARLQLRVDPPRHEI